MHEPLLTSLDHGVLTLTLNRPDKRNALDTAAIDALAQGLARADLEREIRVVVIRGAGKDFCAGADLAELLASADRPAIENERAALALGEIFLVLRRLSKPTVAVVHGRALAGGAGLATACDIVHRRGIIAVRLPRNRAGICSGDGHVDAPPVGRGETRVRAAWQPVARSTPTKLSQWGSSAGCSPTRAFETEAADLLTRLAAQSPTAFALTKQLFTELDQRTFDDGILLGARVNALSRTGPDFRRAIAEFLNR